MEYCRYEVPDVVRADLTDFESNHSWDKKKTFAFGPEGRHKITIDVNPFHLSLYDEEELVISVNDRNLLKYELPQQKAAPAPGPEEEQKTEEEQKATEGESKPA